jgi:hypothetical protein
MEENIDFLLMWHFICTFNKNLPFTAEKEEEEEA